MAAAFRAQIATNAAHTRLAAGVSPSDGSSLPAGTPLQSPDVVRALFLAADSLESRARLARRRTNLPRNAGIEARLVKHGRLDAEQAPAARIR